MNVSIQFFVLKQYPFQLLFGHLHSHENLRNANKNSRGGFIMTNSSEGKTWSGTDIEEVKRKNAASGLSYNEVKAILVKTGGHGTAVYSDTNVEQVKKQIHSSSN